MSEGPNKPVFHTSEINSFLDLKTEFLQKKKELNGRTSYSGGLVNQTKNNIFAGSKQEKEGKRLEKDARTTRIRRNEAVLQKEEEERLKRQVILEEKSSIYERMSRGEAIVYEDGTKAEFLVDFHLKKRELEEKQNAELLAPSTSKDAEFDEPETPLIVHYDHAEEKGRVFGASHVSLGVSNEEERLKNIAALKNLSAETALNRQKRKSALLERKAADRIRLNRLRARKGLPLLYSSSSDEEHEEDNNSEIKVNLDEIPLPSDDLNNEAKKPRLEEPKPKYGVEREWDSGKVIKGYQKWITEQRDDRNDEFRPPSFYYSKK